MQARKVTEEHYLRYRKWAASKGLSEKSIYSHLTIIKQVFRWGARLKRIPANPFDHISLSEPPSSQQFCPTREQVAVLLAAASEEDRPLFAFLAYTGCRIGEAVELRWSDVTLRPDGGHILICRGGSRGTTKTGGVRRIPIHPMLRGIIDALPRKTDRVFTRSPSQFDPQGVEPLNTRKCLNRLQAAAKVLNLSGNQRFKLHSFRHFFCSELAKEGAPERYVRGLLGHKDSSVTDLYFKMHDPAALDAIKLIHIPPPEVA